MIKTKIIFVTQRMMMGGIEKALITMLEQIPKDKFDITVLLIRPGGELLNNIPAGVKVRFLFDEKHLIINNILKNIKQGKLLKTIKILWYRLLIKKGIKSNFKNKMYHSEILPVNNSKYDLAIAYHSLTTFPIVYVAENIIATRKIAWIHSEIGDLEEHLKFTDLGKEIRYSEDEENYTHLIKKYQKIYESYDKVFCVSQQVKKKFSDIFPRLANKSEVFYNLINAEKIKLISKESESYSDLDEYNGVRILTIGRLDWEKGQDLIPEVLFRLLSEGYNVRWYCIGKGGIQSELNTLIKKYHLESNLILLGTKQNPYSYLKDCDLYIQPSRQEGYCITVAEARVFNKPIIITNTGASEQLIDGKTGLIINFDKEELYKGIKKLLDDQVLKNMFINNLKKETVDTTSEIDKLYKEVNEVY